MILQQSLRFMFCAEKSLRNAGRHFWFAPAQWVPTEPNGRQDIDKTVSEVRFEGDCRSAPDVLPRTSQTAVSYAFARIIGTRLSKNFGKVDKILYKREEHQRDN